MLPHFQVNSHFSRGLSAPRSLSASDPNASAGAASLPHPRVRSHRSRRRAPNPPERGATPIRFFSTSMLTISNAPVIPAVTAADHLCDPRVGSERGRVRQRFDARLQLDERAELRDARDAARAHLADLVRGLDARPGIGGQLLQPEGDLLLVLVHAQDLDRDLRRRA